MAAKSLAHGMGVFFKDCEHPQSRWSKCPHEYKFRYRDATGKQTQESGFPTQDRAINRLTEVYNSKKVTPRNQARAERIKKHGAAHFSEYVAEWKARRRHLADSSVRNLDSLLEHHLFPAFRSPDGTKELIAMSEATENQEACRQRDRSCGRFNFRSATRACIGSVPGWPA
ncbi:hypothetical protein ACGF8B_10975 [Streptomyces sp. NPDC047917]|uniref:hypothetical protein n=1 Tax=Streptomyces sp. NPDC047917 TaxID=3365491 RepID=UPI00371C9C98